jgi:hypothetical protein
VAEDILDSVSSLSELASLLQSPAWGARLDEVGTNSHAYEALR